VDGGNIRKSTGARPQPRTGNLLVRPRIKKLTAASETVLSAAILFGRKKAKPVDALQKLAFRKSLDDDSSF
jgi:hypothetical protein